MKNNETVVHFITRENMQGLYNVFAELRVVNDTKQWMIPRWLKALYKSAKPEGSAQHYPTETK